MKNKLDRTQASIGYPGFGLFSEPGTALVLVLLWAALLAVFNMLPGIDVLSAGWFFAEVPCPEDTDPAKICGRFFLKDQRLLQILRQVLQISPVVLAVGIFVLVLVSGFWNRGLKRPDTVVATTAIVAFIAGPGLLVNGFLKPNSGRPRPRDTQLFGGDQPFVPAGELTDYCPSNCSFVSGEASSVFWLVCLIPLLPQKFRIPAATAIVSVAVYASVMRIGFGGHYLSDVVLGALITPVLYSIMAVIVSQHTRRLSTVR